MKLLKNIFFFFLFPCVRIFFFSLVFFLLQLFDLFSPHTFFFSFSILLRFDDFMTCLGAFSVVFLSYSSPPSITIENCWFFLVAFYHLCLNRGQLRISFNKLSLTVFIFSLDKTLCRCDQDIWAHTHTHKDWSFYRVCNNDDDNDNDERKANWKSKMQIPNDSTSIKTLCNSVSDKLFAVAFLAHFSLSSLLQSPFVLIAKESLELQLLSTQLFFNIKAQFLVLIQTFSSSFSQLLAVWISTKKFQHYNNNKREEKQLKNVHFHIWLDRGAVRWTLSLSLARFVGNYTKFNHFFFFIQQAERRNKKTAHNSWFLSTEWRKAFRIDFFKTSFWSEVERRQANLFFILQKFRCSS